MSHHLQEAMRALGFKPPDRIPAGKTTRFSTNGKRSDLSGWVHLFPDEQGAVFGCWRTGIKQVWQAKRERPLNQAELAEFNRKIKAAEKSALLEREAGYQRAAEEARKEWQSAKSADESHPYIILKGIKPHMARVNSSRWLLIPVYGDTGEIQSLQRIAPNGQKRFFAGGRMRNGHVWIGNPEDSPIILICEGFATASSLHSATRYPVCVCFSAGNLRDVAEMCKRSANPIYPSQLNLLT